MPIPAPPPGAYARRARAYGPHRTPRLVLTCDSGFRCVQMCVRVGQNQTIETQARWVRTATLLNTRLEALKELEQ